MIARPPSIPSPPRRAKSSDSSRSPLGGLPASLVRSGPGANNTIEEPKPLDQGRTAGALTRQGEGARASPPSGVRMETTSHRRGFLPEGDPLVAFDPDSDLAPLDTLAPMPVR